jgi:competence ComEA-like helix-hairpin-helix protein
VYRKEKSMKMSRFLFILAAFFSFTLFTVPTACAAGRININTASKRMLERLPGVGENTAELIISFRKENGSFKSVSELREIPGIGEKRFEALKRVATVGALAEDRDVARNVKVRRAAERIFANRIRSTGHVHGAARERISAGIQNIADQPAEQFLADDGGNDILIRKD